MLFPTPAGVPVEIISPGSNVTKEERKAISSATLKIINPVLESCLISPLTFRVILSACGSGISLAGVRQGPMGAKPSCHFPCSQSKNPSISRFTRPGLG